MAVTFTFLLSGHAAPPTPGRFHILALPSGMEVHQGLTAMLFPRHASASHPTLWGQGQWAAVSKGMGHCPAYGVW